MLPSSRRSRQSGVDGTTTPGGKPKIILKDEHLIDWFVNGVVSDNGDLKHGEPLFINGVNSLRYRPTPTTRIENLFLAGDYVRTETDLATMEAANESARVAVNALLIHADSPEQPCRLWKYEPLPPEAVQAFALAATDLGAHALQQLVKGAGVVNSLFRRFTQSVR